MPDVVVTVPKDRWKSWIEEGDLPGDKWQGDEWYFYTSGVKPEMNPGDRVYIVAHGKLRGYAPLKAVRAGYRRNTVVFTRRGGAVAVTIPETIPGFRGWRYRWWKREEEVPFPDWRNP